MVLFIFLFYATCVFASNPFNLGKVEYFSIDKKALSKQMDQMQSKIDWREPVMGSDGKMTYYVPPDPVLHFLNDPSAENARIYVDWQNIKMERIAKAQEVLEKVQMEKLH